MGIRRFRSIFLKFTQKLDLASSTSERAKRRLRKPTKPSIVYTSEARIASERSKRSLRKSSKASIVRTSEASFASEQAKCSLRKPAKAKQTKQTIKRTQINLHQLLGGGQGTQAKQNRISKQATQVSKQAHSEQASRQASNQPSNQTSPLIFIGVPP